MSIAVAVSLDRVRIPIAQERVAQVAHAVLRAERVRDAMLSVTFLSTAAMTRLNKRHLRRNRPTDVIAFGFRRTARSAPVIGDVYIAPEVARASAASNGISVREELVRLVVHGTLHVLGYDHPESEAREKSRMWRRQERLVQKLKRTS
ncbi:MAG TPA: rRNA maturation RNase YbeY [Gemmatimonadaceae bacterium]|nr:rRNA maturation RNase YbeY [Gemmatimonadaceae bacterium]